MYSRRYLNFVGQYASAYLVMCAMLWLKMFEGRMLNQMTSEGMSVVRVDLATLARILHVYSNVLYPTAGLSTQ